MFRCDTCGGRTFVSEAAYRSHMEGAMVHKPFKCTFDGCKKAFKSELRLNAHRDKMHLNKPPSCSSCDVLFNTRKELERHWAEEHARVKCPRCPETFEDAPGMFLHRSTKHPLIRCAPCSKYIYQDDLKEHWAESANHPTCENCNESFENETSMSEHVLATHGSKQHCSRCSLDFPSTNLLHQHYLLSNAHPSCDDCKLGFETNAEYVSHRHSTHPRPKSISIPAPGVASSSKAALASLIASSINGNKEARKPLVLPSVNAADYITCEASPFHPTCASCQIGFKNKEEYIKHVAAEHPAIKSSQPSCKSNSAPEPHQPKTLINGHPLRRSFSNDNDETKSQSSSDADTDECITLAGSSSGTPSPALKDFEPHIHIDGCDDEHDDLSMFDTKKMSLDVDALVASPVVDNEAIASKRMLLPRNATMTSVFSVSVSPVNVSKSDKLALVPFGAEKMQQSVPQLSRPISRPATPSHGAETKAPASQIAPQPQQAVVAPAAPQPSSLWTCRICDKAPSQPTATICGHVFCHECIVEELSKNFGCPVCHKTMLVRLSV
ncbi:hypothetical protein C8Q75DRAFT_488956 [Abortiporus biennis]|nr:hypothetical protein C8Q75DRAFT_488956 [Abortiporus biennis]